MLAEENADAQWVFWTKGKETVFFVVSFISYAWGVIESMLATDWHCKAIGLD